MVYLFLANGFEECEALFPLDILRRGGTEVKTVGICGEYITGSHGITVKADILEKDVVLNDEVEAVILPGGMPGTTNLLTNNTVKNTIKFANNNDRLLCAICAAPLILGSMDVLKNKNAICYPGFEEYLKGAAISDNFVVKDCNIITAKGVGVAMEFGIKILAALKGEEKAKHIAKQMQCRTEV